MYIIVMSAPTAPDDLAFSALPAAPVVPELPSHRSVGGIRRLRSGLSTVVQRLAAGPGQPPPIRTAARTGGRPAPRARAS